jgi:O-antigen/teichoic acid export membrane protein
MNPFLHLRRRFTGLSGRSKAVGLFFATSVAARTLGICCQLLQVPIAVKMLGAEAFGLWMALTSIGTMIMFADFGMGQGAQNKLAEAFAAGKEGVARELCGSVAVFLCLLGLLLAAAVRLIVPALNFTALFNLTDPVVRAQAPHAILISLLLFCANFPLGLAQRLAYSRQKGWMHNITQALGGAGSLAGVLLVAHFHLGLTEFIAAAQLPLILAYAGLLSLQLIQLGWFNFRTFRFRWATMSELFGLGACFGIQQVHLLLLISLPQVIISTSLGAAAVTPYNLAQRIFNLFTIIQNAFMLPLWPAYSEAKARGEFDWIRRTLFFSLRFTVVCVIAPMTVGALFAKPILALWVGRTAALPSEPLVWLLFLWNALFFLQQPFGYVLAGISEVRQLTVYSVVSIVASATLMYLLVHRYAQEGVVLGMIVGFLPYLFFGNIAGTIRFFRLIHGRPKAHPALAEPSPLTLQADCIYEQNQR